VRIFEIVNPADQLELWKLISTSVWQSIEQQALDQQKQQAALVSKSPPRLKGRMKGRSRLPKPIQPIASPKKSHVISNRPTPSKQTSAISQPPAQNKPNPQTLNAVKPIHTANPQINQATTSTTANPKLGSATYPTPLTTAPVKPPNGLKTGYFGKNIGALRK
jgi:hypothetical protein